MKTTLETSRIYLNNIIEFVKEKHINQKYGEREYIEHLHEVAKMSEYLLSNGSCWEDFNIRFNMLNLIHNFDDHDVYKVAYLHDVLEDTNANISDLKNLGLSEQVIKAVQLLTKTDGYIYSDYINNIKQNSLAKIVKISDTLCNLKQSFKPEIINIESSNPVKNYAKKDFYFIHKYTKQLNLLTDKEDKGVSL